MDQKGLTMDQKGPKSNEKGATNSVVDQKYLTAESVNRKWFFPHVRISAYSVQIFNADYVLIIVHKPKRIGTYEKNPHGQL